jgi:hypothetical protein
MKRTYLHYYYLNYIKIKILTIIIIYSLLKTNSIHFNYSVDDLLIVRTAYVIDLGVTMDSKLYFHPHVDYLTFSGIVSAVAHSFHHNFSPLHSPKI